MLFFDVELELSISIVEEEIRFLGIVILGFWVEGIVGIEVWRLEVRLY